MTDRELLELLVQKFSGMEQKVSGIEQKVSGIEQKVSGIEQKVSGIEQNIKFIKTQQSEHGEILKSVRHAQEVQKSQIDSIQMEIARLSGEMNQGFSDISEVQKSLLEMYGEHEAEIRALRRRPV